MHTLGVNSMIVHLIKMCILYWFSANTETTTIIEILMYYLNKTLISRLHINPYQQYENSSKQALTEKDKNILHK